MSQKGISRRSFLQASAFASAGAVAAGNLSAQQAAVTSGSGQAQTMLGVPFKKHDKVRLGIIGLGERGTGHVRDFLAIPDVEITAICDIVPDAVEKARQRIVAAGKKEPAIYGKNEDDWKNLCKRGDLDLVFVVTPWLLHVPNAVAAMEGGAHAAVEVPAAIDLNGCWQLVEVSEKTRRHCMMMENCNYGRTEMMVLNMVEKGLFGTITHGEAAYIHNLRTPWYISKTNVGPWRRPMHTRFNGNLYPTHGLGPVCWYMGIHKGDRLASLVSFSSPEASLTEFMNEKFEAGDPRKGEKYICGDMNTSIIKTAKGRTIMLQHDVVTPRPYSRHNMIQGSKGCFADYPARIHIDGVTREHQWDNDMKSWDEKYGHPLWKELEEQAKLSGHGGMDFIMNYRLVQCMKQGLVPDFNVYDAAAWSAPFPLSIASVQSNGKPQDFPDFTKGLWKG
jgi:predicted dehydrogenase